MDACGEIYWSLTGNPRRKIYLDQSLGKPAQDIWLDYKDAHNQNVQVTGYPTEKNPDLLRRIIEASSDPGDLVLDCFAGSGTTLEAAAELNRRWIGVDNSKQAIKAILKRFAVGREAMGDFVSKEGANGAHAPMSLFDFAAQKEQQETPLKVMPEETKARRKFAFSVFTITENRDEAAKMIVKWQTAETTA